MHFVTGGAFSGKREWVMNYYDLNDRTDFTWHNCYENKEVINPTMAGHESIYVFEGLEMAIKHRLQTKYDRLGEYWRNWLHLWKQWEMEANRQVIFISCDITKGIVPMNPHDRQWRDMTGWCYQDIARQCTRVDVIWNGLNQTIKGGMRDEVIYKSR